MYKIRPDTILAAVLITGATTVTQAAELSFNGFASIVGGRVLDEDDVFEEIDITGFKENSLYDSDTSFSPDSMYALQAIADVGDGISLTAQIVGRGAREFEPEIEWAYITYKVSDFVSVSAGKKRMPLFYYSDFLDVGYAYHWIRPPVAVYANELTSYQGVDASFSFQLGSVDANLSVYGGNADPHGENHNNDDITSLLGRRDFQLHYDEILGITGNLSYDWFRIRGTYAKAQIEVNSIIPVLGDGRIQILDTFIDFAGVGIFLTPGNWTIGAEYTQFEFDDTVNAEDNWFATIGYRFGSVMPHITYSKSDNQGNISEAAETDLENITVGLRWDFHPSTAFKIEYSENDITAPPGQVDTDAQLVSVGLDIIF